MEACFSQLTLDVIGKAVFNYDFNALTTDSPLIQVRTRFPDESIHLSWLHTAFDDSCTRNTGLKPHVLARAAESSVVVSICVLRRPADWPRTQPSCRWCMQRLCIRSQLLMRPRAQTLALTTSTPLSTLRSASARAAQAVYTALKETESRATDLVPLWRLPGASAVVPRLRRAAAAVQLIRDTTEMLIAQCKVRGIMRCAQHVGRRWSG